MNKHKAAPKDADTALLTVEQVAEWLHLTPGYVRRRLIFEQRIPYIEIGRYVRIEADAVESLIDRGRVEPRILSNSGSREVRSLREIREERLATWRTSASTL